MFWPGVAADPRDNALNIKIRATDGSEVFFKIKKTTKLNKLKVKCDGVIVSLTLQNAYADRVGQDPGAIRYVVLREEGSIDGVTGECMTDSQPALRWRAHPGQPDC